MMEAGWHVGGGDSGGGDWVEETGVATGVEIADDQVARLRRGDLAQDRQLTDSLMHTWPED